MATENKLSKELEHQMAALNRLRDEIRVRAHLLGMDAKDAFKALEKEADKLARGLASTSKDAIADVAERLKRLSEQLKEKN